MTEPTILAHAEEFIWSNARLLERRQFAHQFKGAAAEPVLVALRAYQNDDGGFPAFGTVSDAGFTADAVFAIASTGIDPSSVQKAGRSPSNYLASQAASFSATAGGAAKRTPKHDGSCRTSRSSSVPGL